MEIYVHLPFCVRKCRYCDFVSFSGCEAMIPDYTDSLLREAAAWKQRLGQVRAATVFLGGGTPSLLPERELARLLEGLDRCFPFETGAEITSEANPGTLRAAWLETAVRCGVSRLSIGMQAAQDRLLAMLGRIHRQRDTQEAVRLVREAGIDNFSLDLMFGLPGQTMDDWRETLSTALALGPSHLSCYGLIVEAGTPLKTMIDRGELALPPEDLERAMYDLARRMTAEAGMEQYEISNFAKPGLACRHNIGYWRQTPYLGLGVSAASMLPDPQGRYAYLRLTNPGSMRDYAACAADPDSPLRAADPVTREEARFETLMLGLRMTEGVSEEAFERMHGVQLSETYGARLETLRQEGLLLHEDGAWRLTERGMDIQNQVLVSLMD